MNYVTSLSSLLVKKFGLTCFTLSCTRILISLVSRRLFTPFPHFFRCLSKDSIVIYFKQKIYHIKYTLPHVLTSKTIYFAILMSQILTYKISLLNLLRSSVANTYFRWKFFMKHKTVETQTSVFTSTVLAVLSTMFEKLLILCSTLTSTLRKMLQSQR